MSFFEELAVLVLRPGILTLITGIVIASITWLLNERGKRRHNDYLRKEERYVALIDNIQGFYSTNQNKKQKDEFLKQLNRSWLYCPDEIIEKGYAFLSTVHTGGRFTDEQKETTLGELIVALRNDLLTKKLLVFSRTKLKAKDFRNLTST